MLQNRNLIRTPKRRLVLALIVFSLGVWGYANAMAADPPSAAKNNPDVVVVCPERFRTTLAAWVQYREGQGLNINVIEAKTSPTETQKSVSVAAGSATKYVLLVGDAPAIGKRCDATRQTPTQYLRTTVTSKWGSTPTLASDMPLGDFDSDKIPDAAVGRFPVQRESELKRLIDRIIAYENSDDFGAWRGQVQLVGGIGGFGVMADAAIESVTRTVVTSVLPSETRTNVAYASPGHLFYPKDDAFTDAVIKRYQQGARFWVYAGHGHITALDRVPQTRDGVPVLDYKSIVQLNRPAKAAPIALMLACYTGAIDAPSDSLGERMMLVDGGPIAVFAGSRITMPYGNTTAAVGLIKGVYEEKQPRLGDCWLSTLKQMYADEPDTKSTSRIMIDAIATLVSPTGTKLVDERHEHMGLYNLFGDPLLKMHHPMDAQVTVAPGFDQGMPVEIEVLSPVKGELAITLDRPLGAITDGDPNKTTVATLSMSVSAGTPARQKIAIPSNVAGPLIVRAIVSGTESWATGAAKTQIRTK